jgi:hypothetical protein
MVQPSDSLSDTERSDEDERAVAVKDDPQFTLAVTRGMCYTFRSVEYKNFMKSGKDTKKMNISCL